MSSTHQSNEHPKEPNNKNPRTLTDDEIRALASTPGPTVDQDPYHNAAAGSIN